MILRGSQQLDIHNNSYFPKTGHVTVSDIKKSVDHSIENIILRNTSYILKYIILDVLILRKKSCMKITCVIIVLKLTYEE